jgi:hypothetical protein
MKKVQNTFLVLTLMMFLNCLNIRADDIPPVLPSLPVPSQTLDNIPTTNQKVTVKAIDANSQDSHTVAVINKPNGSEIKEHNTNILLLESILYYLGDIEDPITYIGPRTLKLQYYEPQIYILIDSIKHLNPDKRGAIARFLKTNFKTKYLPSEMFNKENAHLAKPLYMTEIVNWAFNAVVAGNINVLRILLDNYDFLLNIKNDEGYGLLSYAILHQRNDIMYMLIYHGANLNEENKYMAKPINIAARTNNFEAVKILISNGCDVSHQDVFGKTSLDYAQMNNNTEMYDYLLMFKRA